jgi:hypothetical protein
MIRTPRRTGVLMSRAAASACRLITVAFAATLLSGMAALAQGAPSPAPADPVVARVNGQDIHLSDIKEAAQT